VTFILWLDNININDLVDLVPFFCFDHNMQQSGTTATQVFPNFAEKKGKIEY
jgi:hypothetical protein